MIHHIRLIIKEQSKTINLEDFEQIISNSINGIQITPRGDAPGVWDSYFEIDNDNVIISGGVDACGFGEVTVRIPKKDACEYYTFIIECKSTDKAEKVRDVLTKCGYGLDISIID